MMTDTDSWTYFIVYVPDPEFAIDHMAHARSYIGRPDYIEVYSPNGRGTGKIFTLCGIHIERPNRDAFNQPNQPVCCMCLESINEPVPHTWATLELSVVRV